MSPLGLIRNVPLNWRLPRRSWIGADGDEYDRAAARGRVGAGRSRHIDVGIGGGIDGGELSPGEALVWPVPRRGRDGPETSERRTPLESGDGHAAAPTRAGADS